MHVKRFRVENFRRLKNAVIDLDATQTVFVGANNSGKTSATQLLQLFLSQDSATRFQIFDFTSDCWSAFDSFDPANDNPADLPRITCDIWFEVDDENVHRVLHLIPDLTWVDEPVGLRMSYEPRDGENLATNFAEAKEAAESTVQESRGSFEPWPTTMFDYLKKRIHHEYEIRYFVLDAKQCDAHLVPNQTQEPFLLGTRQTGASKIVDSIIRVDFLNAQRHLSDAESSGRGEDLSKRLSRFYSRNLAKLEQDVDALGAIADAETRLNTHFATVFEPILNRLEKVGYPGITNAGLVVKGSFDAQSVLSSSAKVHYALPTSAGDHAASERTLPDQYNGLGFKNLIYMVVELLDFHHAWADAERDRPPIHLVVIEEPEAHLHAQLQQVFIRQIQEILPSTETGFNTQLIVTTHSPHVIYESDFTPIRYFCRSVSEGGWHLSEVKNLSTFCDNENVDTREFLQRYLKLTHCDLFFADGAVLVEGNVERLLVPLIVERSVPQLQSCHLTILEVGGAFAHRFRTLIEFLAVPTLIITDLDSVAPPTAQPGKAEGRPSACPTSTHNATTSNPTLKQWVPAMTNIEDLLSATDEEKEAPHPAGMEADVRVAYQTNRPVSWQSDVKNRAGRTLEEAFALENLDWVQSVDGEELGLRIQDAQDKSLEELHDDIFERVKSFDKTRFALNIIATANQNWKPPTYIVEGLNWLAGRLTDEVSKSAASK